MAKLTGIARLIKSGMGGSPVDSFFNELVRTIQNCEEVREPSKAYKPSSLGGCLRNVYFQMTGAKLDGIPTDYCSIGICESGTDRHETLQKYVARMSEFGFDCEWVDVEEYVNTFKPEGTKVIRKQGMETKCFNEKYNLRFLCDGIVKYKGKYYILEIKTESTYKFSNHDEPHPAHKVQAATYSLAFGINDVIFLYENRDNTTKKAFLYEVSDADRQSVVDKIKYCDECIEKQTPPPKTTNKKDCTYCDYKKHCREAGDTLCQQVKTSKRTSPTHSRKRINTEF